MLINSLLSKELTPGAHSTEHEEINEQFSIFARSSSFTNDELWQSWNVTSELEEGLSALYV